jgi:type I restriction enzyme S subunit
MVSKSLKEVVLKPITGEWGTEGNNVQILRTTNFTNEGRVNYLKVVERNVDSNKIEKKKLKIGDIIIEKSGGSPKQPVGRVVFFEKEGVFLCNNFTAILRPKVDEVVPKYLLYILYCNHKFGFTSAYQNKTTGIINLQLPKYLEGTKIPLPPLDQQKKIAAILDAADAYRQKTKALITKYEELTQSLFLDMFGDPVINTKKWGIKKLEEVAKITSGITKGRKVRQDEFIGELPYMRVANVQDGFLELSEIKTIPAYKSDLNRFKLSVGDVLMTEGGDPDKLGRGAVWNGEIETCLHQNHIFKIKVNKEILNPVFFSMLSGSQYGKRYFLKIAKQTTGIATINKTQLSKFPVLIVPLVLQNQFAERVKAIEAQKTQAQRSLTQAEDLFNSLLQKAFKGELS